MYNIELFDKAGINPEAGAIICGIRESLIDPMAVRDYAERLIIQNSDDSNEFTDMLVFEGNAEEAVECMKNHGFDEDDSSFRCLRYAILASLSTRGQKLLEDIEGIYASFGYPQDMEHLIYYMPSADGGGSQEELIAKFNDFLKSERTALGI